MGISVDGGHEAQVSRQRYPSLGQGWAGLLQVGLCSGGPGRIQNFRGDLLPGNGESTVVLWLANGWEVETVGLGTPGLDITGWG